MTYVPSVSAERQAVCAEVSELLRDALKLVEPHHVNDTMRSLYDDIRRGLDLSFRLSHGAQPRDRLK